MASAAGQDDPAGEHKQMSIHVREDSASELDALFDISLNKTAQKHLQVPMRMRTLPESFWKPPTFGSKSPSVHSRENSLDNSLGQGPFSPGPIASPGPPSIAQSHHSRANSCPATLGQTLAVAQQHQVRLLFHHYGCPCLLQDSPTVIILCIIYIHVHSLSPAQGSTTRLTITLIIPTSRLNIKQHVEQKKGRKITHTGQTKRNL